MTVWPLHNTYYSSLQKLHLFLKYIQVTVWPLYDTYYSSFQKTVFTVFIFTYTDVGFNYMQTEVQMHKFSVT